MLSDIRDVILWICRDGINTMISSIPRTSLCRGCFCFYYNRKQLVLGIIVKQNCCWKIVVWRMQGVRSIASINLYAEEKEHFFCLRCTHDFPNPFLFDYNCLMSKFAHIKVVFTFNTNQHKRRNRFCLFFSKNFNILSALSDNQPLILPQKIDSREGFFWCKKGLACACGKMYIHSHKPPLAPVLRLFGAIRLTFWC